MKIIHTGDIHLGAAMKNLPPDKGELRKAELLDAFRRLATFSKNNGVEAVLIAGDLFDENRVLRRIKREVFAVIAAAAPVRFFYVSGNHDDEFDFDDELPNNLYLFSKNHGWQSYELSDNVILTGLDSKYVEDARYKELSLRRDSYNIVMLHGDVTKGDSREKTADGLALARLQNKHIDYLALGHIHKPTLTAEKLDSRGHYRYCGCLEGRGFDECGQKGFFLLEVVDGRLIKEEFLSVAKRTVREARADVSACGSYFDVERTAFEALSGANPVDIVRLTLCGRHKAGLRKDLPLLSARLCETFFFARVEDESTTYVDPAVYQNDLSELGEFVREVGRYEMNEDLRGEILDVGIKALIAEDIDL